MYKGLRVKMERQDLSVLQAQSALQAQMAREDWMERRVIQVNLEQMAREV